MKPCTDKTNGISIELEKLLGLSPDMQELYCRTKINQFETIRPNNLKKIDGIMNPVNVYAMTRSKDVIKEYSSISCSISGGSDSDIVMDILARSVPDRMKDIHFVFFDTGIEYTATKNHLLELENKYGVHIERERAIKSIPHCCNTYGVPFISKSVSERIYRLQSKGFKFEDKPLNELEKEYPKCRLALRWWCNDFGEGSRFNIDYNKGLKQFLINNPPDFKISAKCCDYAKKKVIHNFNDKISADLSIMGVRKAEGGARSTAYKSCFTDSSEGISNFRPIFWFKDNDKKEWEVSCDVQHSDCYSKYGMRRTGCAGCPFGRDLEEELNIIKTYEPRLYMMVNNVFGKSYEYTRKYRQYVMNLKSE